VTWQLASILPVWALAILGAVLIGLISDPEHYFVWVAIVFAAAIIGAFVVQLAIRRKEGFVSRVMTSTGGALAVLAVASVVFVAVS
jgi:membrane glycosyltransferase